ncbi:MAG: BatD family protein, partial [Desulfobulbaceae bacterium]|nr:BatD family protein [Desulfobulbaceae bacterium]
MNIFTRNGIIDSFTSFFTNNGDTTRLMSALFNHRRFYWCILTLLACCLVFGSTALRAEDLQVSVDRNRLAFGESFTLTVDTAMKLTGEVDFSPLEQDFEILSTSKGSRINYINGQVEASTTWTLELSPKKEGQLTIPPLQINGSQSKAISITVDKNVPGSAELYSDI